MVRRSGHSISHSGLNGQRAQSPEPLLIPRLCLGQVPLTRPRAAGQLSCPRGTQVRSPWPDRGHSGPLRVGRTQTLPLTGRCVHCPPPPLAAPGSSPTPGAQPGARARSPDRKEAPGPAGARAGQGSIGWLAGLGFRLPPTRTWHGPASGCPKPRPDAEGRAEDWAPRGSAHAALPSS